MMPFLCVKTKQVLSHYTQIICLFSAAFMFFNFFLSVCATIFAVKAIEEIRTKQREDYNRLAVLSDTLQFEADQA